MKTYLKIFSFVFLAFISFNSCKKTNYSSEKTNLAGKWYSSFSGTNSGSYFVFSDNYMNYFDYRNSSSNEDDENVSGTASIHNDIIRMRSYRFKIEEYATRIDTSIFRGGNIIPTHWRIKLKIGYLTSHSWQNIPTQEYYKE